MPGVPINFQSISNVIPSYNFVDIASGTGYINFYLGTTSDTKSMTNYAFYSDTLIETGAVTSGTADVLTFDHDFDVLLNRPLDIAGLGIVNVPCACYSNAGGGQTATYVTVVLRKWNGVTETDIVSNTSRQISNTAITYAMFAVDLTIPLTHFKIGETLRITIKLYGSKTAPSDGQIYYAHDPKGRTTGWDATGAVPTTLIFQCPVRLNI